MASITTTPPVLPSAPPAAGAPAASQNTAQQEQSQFLQLLVAQLKGQDPLNPQDPTQFVSQLAQFSSLEQLISIRTDLDGMAKTSATSAAPATPETNPSVNPFQGAN